MKKEIVYNAESRDYSLFLDGVMVGVARNRTEADTKLSQAALARLREEQFWANRADMEHLRLEFPEGYNRILAKRAAHEGRSS